MYLVMVLIDESLIDEVAPEIVVPHEGGESRIPSVEPDAPGW